MLFFKIPRRICELFQLFGTVGEDCTQRKTELKEKLHKSLYLTNSWIFKSNTRGCTEFMGYIAQTPCTIKMITKQLYQ